MALGKWRWAAYESVWRNAKIKAAAKKRPAHLFREGEGNIVN